MLHIRKQFSQVCKYLLKVTGGGEKEDRGQSTEHRASAS